jgi:hypothetical protein
MNRLHALRSAARNPTLSASLTSLYKVSLSCGDAPDVSDIIVTKPVRGAFRSQCFVQAINPLVSGIIILDPRRDCSSGNRSAYQRDQH